MKKEDTLLKLVLIIVILVIFPLIFLVSYIVEPKLYFDPNYSDSLGQNLHSAADIPIGVAVNSFQLRYNQKYRNVLAYHFDCVTPENEMKMEFLAPAKDVYRWSEADLIVDFAERIGAEVIGHTLICDTQLPSWVYSFSGNQTEWKNMLKSYIQTVVGHYKGRIKTWIVVNEAIEDEGFKDTIWYEKIGVEYFNDAFRWAYEADPNASLFYNDYGLCNDPSKLDSVLNIINSSITQGVPIHGIGFQTHISLFFNDPTNTTIQMALQKAEALNLSLRVTELDIESNPDNNYNYLTPAMSQSQKQRYQEVVSLFLNSSKTIGITVWGVSDACSWKNTPTHPDWPLLFDENYAPKPAAEGFLNALLSS
ncbi:MAG: endo-1,4-beta-xylanase [Promethearchaeota archaeon]